MANWRDCVARIFVVVSAIAALAVAADAGTVTYTYDSLGRLATASYADGSTVTYGYDPAGNRTQQVVLAPCGTSCAPVANAVSATVAVNSTNNPITLNITGGAPASVAVSTAAAHGTATASGTSITYTPTSGYSGADSFQYTATNSHGTSSPASVSITVSAAAPIAGAASATVAYNSANNPITLNITGGAPASVAVSTAAAHGTATASGTSITYAPTSGYSGADSFQYTATNGAGTSAPATVSITVNPAPPIAGAVSATVATNSTNNPITLSLSGGTATSVSVYTTALHGTATANGVSITYTPTASYSGADSFQYKAINAGGSSGAATISITVSPVSNPTAINQAYSVQDTLSKTFDPRVGDTDPNGYALTITGVGTPTLGTAVINSGVSVTYTPYGTDGTDVFTYTISDGHGGTATANITMTVKATVCKYC